MTYVREDTVEQHFVNRVKAAGGVAYKLAFVGVRGAPDRIAFLPGGQLLLVELKAPKKKVFQPGQLRMHRRLRRVGFEVHVAFTKGQVDELPI